MPSIQEKAVEFLGIRLCDEQRAKALAPKLLAEGLLQYDGAAWTIDDTNCKLLSHAPDLLNKAKLRELHDNGDRSAWHTLCDAVHEKLKSVSHQNDRHLIPELNHASPMRLERNPVRDAALAALQKPGVRDDAYWKNLEKNIEAYITGEER